MYDWPRRDTAKSKRKIMRRVNRAVRYLNKNLRKDVFGDRFSIAVVERSVRPWDDHSGWDSRFRIEFRDAKYPERNYSCWFDYHYVIYSGFFSGGRHVDTDLNDFIIRSDFWKNYKVEKNGKVEK